jgi:hypothetical protein
MIRGVLVLGIVACALPSLQTRHLEIAATENIPTPSGTIYTWAENTPAWNQKLHVSGYRIGCAAGDATPCFTDGLAMAQQGHIKTIIVSMELNPKQSANDALTYSQLSLSYPSLAEVTFDDFVDRYGLMLAKANAPPPSWLLTVIRNVKAKNPHLAFGITLYEDELQSPYLKPPYLPVDDARLVDDVHLYIHYRVDAKDLPSYVQKTRAIFPNAQIIAGSYAYDRVNYIPCAPTSSQLCTPDEDVALYKQSIAVEAQMLNQGSIAGIEFYPGYFGMEKQWQGWHEPDYCNRARLQQCVENTLKMRQAAVVVLHSMLAW